MSEEQKDQKRRIFTDLKFPLPDVRASFETHFDIIKAYVVASNQRKDPAGYKELEPFIKIEPTTVSGCNKFFQHMGILESTDKGGKYLPTEITLELYNGLKWKNDDVTKSTLRKILANSWFWNNTKQILEINDSVTKSDLIQKLGLICGADPQKHMRALDKLIDYMRYANLIKTEGDTISLNTSLPVIDDPKPTQPSTEQTIENEQRIFSVEKPISIPNSNNITLGIMITPDLSEEQIRKTVRIVFDELKKIQSEKQE